MVKEKTYQVNLESGKVLKIEARSRDEVMRKLRDQNYEFQVTKIKIKKISNL